MVLMIQLSLCLSKIMSTMKAFYLQYHPMIGLILTSKDKHQEIRKNKKIEHEYQINIPMKNNEETTYIR